MAEATYRYIRKSCDYIIRLNCKIDTMLDSGAVLQAERVFLFGSQDEIFHMLQNRLNEKGMPFEYIKTPKEIEDCLHSGEEIRAFLDVQFKSVVLVWQPITVDLSADMAACVINLLEGM